METEQILIEKEDTYGLLELESFSKLYGKNTCREDDEPVALPISMYRKHDTEEKSKARRGSFERWVHDITFQNKSLEDPLF